MLYKYKHICKPSSTQCGSGTKKKSQEVPLPSRDLQSIRRGKTLRLSLILGSPDCSSFRPEKEP